MRLCSWCCLVLTIAETTGTGLKLTVKGTARDRLLVLGGLMDVTAEAWYSAFDVHVHAVFHLCRAAVPSMREQGEGPIVLISSVAGMRCCLGAIAYGAAKGAIPQFTRALARELADY